MLRIPPLKRLPGPRETWNWHYRYFDVGDKISWVQLCDRLKKEPHRYAGELYSDTVAKIDVSFAGRVSYRTKRGRDFVIMEDIEKFVRRRYETKRRKKGRDHRAA